jgi:hypothetical protein
MADESPIGQLAGAKTEAEFGDQLSSYTTLTSKEIQTLFPKKTDRDELLNLLRIVNAATADNIKQQELITRISEISGAVLKLVKKFAVGL